MVWTIREEQNTSKTPMSSSRGTSDRYDPYDRSSEVDSRQTGFRTTGRSAVRGSVRFDSEGPRSGSERGGTGSASEGAPKEGSLEGPQRDARSVTPNCISSA